MGTNPLGTPRHFPSSRIFSFTWNLEASQLEISFVSRRHSCRESIKLQFTLGFNISLLLRGIGVTKRQKSLFFKQSEIIRLTMSEEFSIPFGRDTTGNLCAQTRMLVFLYPLVFYRLMYRRDFCFLC